MVNKEIEPPEKDFKAVIENGVVKRIGVELTGSHTYFCAPMYKFVKADFLHWLNEMERLIRRGDLESYAEEAFNNISNEVILQAIFFRDTLCMEIDTLEDLKLATNLV